MWANTKDVAAGIVAGILILVAAALLLSIVGFFITILVTESIEAWNSL